MRLTLLLLLLLVALTASSDNGGVLAQQQWNASAEFFIRADGLLLARTSPLSSAFGAVCMDSARDSAVALTVETAAAVCAMLGYRAGTASVSSRGVAGIGATTAVGGASISKLNCPQSAFSLAQCTFVTVPAAQAGECARYVTVQCPVPGLYYAPFFFRLDPLRSPSSSSGGVALLARRRCSPQWASVSSAWRSNTTARGICTILGYDVSAASSRAFATVAPPANDTIAIQLQIRDQANGFAAPLLSFVVCSSLASLFSSCSYLDQRRAAIGIDPRFHPTYNGDFANHTTDLAIGCAGGDPLSWPLRVNGVAAPSSSGTGSSTSEFDDCPEPLPTDRLDRALLWGEDAMLMSVIIAAGSVVVFLMIVLFIASCVYGNLRECLDHWLQDLCGADHWNDVHVDPIFDDMNRAGANDADTEEDAEEAAAAASPVRAGLLLWQKGVLEPREKAVHMLQQDATLNVEANSLEQQTAILTEHATTRLAQEAAARQAVFEAQQRELQRNQRRRDRQRARQERLRQQQAQHGEDAAAAAAAVADAVVEMQEIAAAEPAAEHAPDVVVAGAGAQEEQDGAAAPAAGADFTPRKPDEGDLIVRVPLSLASWWTSAHVATCTDGEEDPRTFALRERILASKSLPIRVKSVSVGYESAAGCVMPIVGIQLDAVLSSSQTWRDVVRCGSKPKQNKLVVPFAIACDDSDGAASAVCAAPAAASSSSSSSSSRAIYFYTLSTFCAATGVDAQIFAHLFALLHPAPPPERSLCATPLDRDGEEPGGKNSNEDDDSSPTSAHKSQQQDASAAVAAAAAAGLVSWSLSCSMCFEDHVVEFRVSSRTARSATLLPGAQCCVPARHFTCAACLSTSIKRLLTSHGAAAVDHGIPCYNGDCAASHGVLSLEDALSRVDIDCLRRVQDAKIAAERSAGQRSLLGVGL